MGKKNEIIYGIRPLIESLKAGRHLEKVWIQKGLRGTLFRELMQTLKDNNTPYQFVPSEKLKAYNNRNHQGIVAFMSLVEFQQLDQILPLLFEKGKTPLILILDQITDVRNMGAIMRTAECTGVHAVVIPEKGSARINADTVKSAAGAINFIPLCREPRLEDTVKFLKNCGLKIFAATEKGAIDLYSASFNDPSAIILGSEEKGISPKVLKYADENISIPIHGHIQSLNVSVAAGVFLYECIRQRQIKNTK